MGPDRIIAIPRAIHDMVKDLEQEHELIVELTIPEDKERKFAERAIIKE